MVRLTPSTTQVEVQAAAVEVHLVVVVLEVSRVVEVEANQIGIKEINGVNDIGTTHGHGIHPHLHTPHMVRPNMQVIGLIMHPLILYIVIFGHLQS